MIRLGTAKARWRSSVEGGRSDGPSDEARTAGSQQDHMHEAWEVKYWTHALGISREELQQAVDKVGNSAAAVRKELAL